MDEENEKERSPMSAWYRNKKSNRLISVKINGTVVRVGTKYQSLESFESDWEAVEAPEVEQQNKKVSIPRLNSGGSNARSETYLAEVRLLPCSNCGARAPSQAAHSNQAMWGKGKGMKAHDVCSFPLCSECHTKHDQTRSIGDDWRAQENIWIIKTLLQNLIKGN
jgi:hypothetical protein